MIEALALPENTDAILRKAIVKSKTNRFFSWMEVSWPNVRPLMVSFAEHLDCDRSEEAQKAFLNVLRATRKAVMQPPKSIQVDLTRADREYLILLYRGFFTASVRELGRVRLGRGQSAWNPLHQSLRSWRRSNQGSQMPKYTGKPKARPKSEEIKSLSECLLGRTDRLILGKEIERIYEPYPDK